MLNTLSSYSSVFLDYASLAPADLDASQLLAELPNLIVTPHIAWASQKARQNIIDQLLKMIIGWHKGEYYNQVTG